MDSSKVIITNQNTITNHYTLESEIGLSSYDLALISINKMIVNRKSDMEEVLNDTYLI